MKNPEIYTEHDVKMAFDDGYQAGYDAGLEKASGAGSTLLCAIISSVFGVILGIALCKFVPVFWMWTNNIIK